MILLASIQADAQLFFFGWLLPCPFILNLSIVWHSITPIAFFLPNLPCIHHATMPWNWAIHPVVEQRSSMDPTP
jgi:hypothetical protein